MKKDKYGLVILLYIFFVLIHPAIADEEKTKTRRSDISVTFSISSPIPARVYLPIRDEKEKELPTLYLLHGQGQNEFLWEELGLAEMLDEMIAADEISPMIVVMPLEENCYQDTHESDFADIITDKLIPFIDLVLPTIASREGRAIGGISHGASWAQKIAFEHLDSFSAVGAHSLPNPFFSDYLFYSLIRDSEVPLIHIYIDCGNYDMYLKGSSDFSQQLFKYFIPHTLVISDGTHDKDYWGSHLRDYILWYAGNFNL